MTSNKYYNDISYAKFLPWYWLMKTMIADANRSP